MTADDAEYIRQKAEKLLEEATMNAWKSLKQGKFSLFGYWSAKAVQFRELLGKSHEPSPFADLVKLAKRKFAQKCVNCGHYLKPDGKSHQNENFSWPEEGEPQTEDGNWGCFADVRDEDDLLEERSVVCGCQNPEAPKEDEELVAV